MRLLLLPQALKNDLIGSFCQQKNLGLLAIQIHQDHAHPLPIRAELQSMEQLVSQFALLIVYFFEHFQFVVIVFLEELVADELSETNQCELIG